MTKIILKLLKKKISTLCYVDNQKVLDSLLNTRAPSVPEIYSRCRESIQNSVVDSVWSIPSFDNTADYMTKACDSQTLKHALQNETCITAAATVLRVQYPNYRKLPIYLLSVFRCQKMRRKCSVRRGFEKYCAYYPKMRETLSIK